MAEQSNQPFTAAYEESLRQLQQLTNQKLIDSMKQSVEELGDFIIEGIDKIDDSFNHLASVTVNRVNNSNVSSSGDGQLGVSSSLLESEMAKLETGGGEEGTFPQQPSSVIKGSAVNPPPTATRNLFVEDNFTPLSNVKIDFNLMQKVVISMSKVRGSVFQDSSSVFLTNLQENEKNIHVLESALQDKTNVSVLDFRTLNSWLEMPGSRKLQHAVIPKLCSEAELQSLNSYLEIINPPNEFDWLSHENMSSILPDFTTKKVFTILKDLKRVEDLQELYLNGASSLARRLNVEETPANPIVDALSIFRNLTKLVMRGICENCVLKVVANTCHCMEYLDVSCSQYISDIGIQQLVFQEDCVTASPLYLLPSWIKKNLNKLNPLMGTLRHLDYSWTAVTPLARKIFQLLPGCYIFKRLMPNWADDDFGHHIFLRDTVILGIPIPPKPTPLFEEALIENVGMNGAKTFIKLVESHPWRSCYLTLYSVSSSAASIIAGNNSNIKAYTKCLLGIVTPNQNERRIRGMIQWQEDKIIQLYTIYSINMNSLGSLNNLQTFRGTLHDRWRMEFSILPDLSQLEIFTEPQTLVSILQFCPNLRRLYVRIRRSSLTDNDMSRVIQSAMCRNTLEELWIAPMIKEGEISVNPSLCTSFTNVADCVTNDVGSPVFSDAGVALSLKFLNLLISSCSNLKRVGDLATWTTVDESQLYMYCEQLKQTKHKIVITWANMNLPDFCNKKKRVKITS